MAKIADYINWYVSLALHSNFHTQSSTTWEITSPNHSLIPLYFFFQLLAAVRRVFGGNYITIIMYVIVCFFNKVISHLSLCCFCLSTFLHEASWMGLSVPNGGLLSKMEHIQGELNTALCSNFKAHTWGVFPHGTLHQQLNSHILDKGKYW